MELKLVRHLWGVDLTRPLASYLPRWREVGYGALEVSQDLVPDPKALFAFMKANGLGWVPQVFSNQFIAGGTVQEHFSSLKSQIEQALDQEPLFFNAHSGSDNWLPAQAEEFYGRVLELEKQVGVPVSHETHRMRYFATPWATREVLEKFPELKVTCDFSHWVCVCERLLPDLGDTIALAASHCHHLHARVGFEEGPQVPDPSAPEYATHLAAHEQWWDVVWASQKQRGMACSTLTPEFGPPPYLHTLPHTNVPVADLGAICDWMAIRQRKRFA